MDSNNKQQRVFLLDDRPETTDAFGAHQRVADAMVSMITSELGGRAVGLEGSWGSGKSTVISLIKKQLADRKNYTVITFDAWAHEGDPLRRTYLESIISGLRAKNWLSKESGDKVVDEISKRLKTTITRITPKPTRLGLIFAISLILVPIGSALFAAIFRQPNAVGIEDFLCWPVIGYISASLAIAPFFVLLINFIRVLFKKKKTGSEWSFLLSKAIEETRTETIESPNPTSIEFENYFNSIMTEALGGDTERRMILVLDNLDRIEPSSAIEIWANLQTFLQEKNGEGSLWYKQVWIVVPYDHAGLSRIWKSHKEIGDQGAPAYESFFDKSFQVRFQVSPPVLSDWKQYLYGLVQKALPDLQEGDKNILYRVYEEWRSEKSVQPTPRSLKKYVNQVGAVFRQWANQFSVGHIAFFVLYGKQGISLVDQLKDKKFPSKKMKRLLGDDLMPNLAGLIFNVLPQKGMEILLSDAIYGALVGRDLDALKDICQKHDRGFWVVLDHVIENKIHDAAESDVANISYSLSHSDILSGVRNEESATVLKEVKARFSSIKDWSCLDRDVAEGIIGGFKLFKDKQLTKSVMDVIAETLSLEKDKSENTNSDVGEALICLFECVDAMGFADQIPESIKIPIDQNEWIDICGVFNYYPDKKELWSRVSPKTDIHIVSVLASVVDAGNFESSYVDAVSVTNECMDVDWSPLVNSIKSRLNPNAINLKAGEAILLIRCLWEMLSFGNDEAKNAINYIVMNGYVMHYLHVIQAAKLKDDSVALCIMTVLHEDPAAAHRVQLGNSANGHALLSKTLASEDEVQVKNYCNLLRTYRVVPKILSIIDHRGSCDSFFSACLRYIADSDFYDELFSTDVVLVRWSDLENYINDYDLFASLIERLVNNKNLCDGIINSGNGFSLKDARLYCIIVSCEEVNKEELFEWCKAGLEGNGKDVWLSDLRGSHDFIWLSCQLYDRQLMPKLTTPFLDALSEHATDILNGKCIPEKIIVERWEDVVSLLDEGSRRTLGKNILGCAISVDGDLHDALFDLYGSLICNAQLIISNVNSIEGLFSPILRKRNLLGIKWLNTFFEENGKFLENLDANHNGEGFATRLRDCVNAPEQDEAQQLIEQLANRLGIKPAQPEVKDESEGSEQ